MEPLLLIFLLCDNEVIAKDKKKKNKVIAKAVLLFVAFALNRHLHLCVHIDMYI